MKPVSGLPLGLEPFERFHEADFRDDHADVGKDVSDQLVGMILGN
jgi:hypothetical protein